MKKPARRPVSFWNRRSGSKIAKSDYLAAGAGAAAGAAGAAGASFLPQAVTARARRAATRSDCFIFFPLIKVVEEYSVRMLRTEHDYKSSLIKLYTV